jgi:hypothetical protein
MKKSTPNLPASSRLKGASGNAASKPTTQKNGKATAAVKAGGVVKLGKGGGMKMKSKSNC